MRQIRRSILTRYSIVLLLGCIILSACSKRDKRLEGFKHIKDFPDHRHYHGDYIPDSSSLAYIRAFGVPDTILHKIHIVGDTIQFINLPEALNEWADSGVVSKVYYNTSCVYMTTTNFGIKALGLRNNCFPPNYSMNPSFTTMVDENNQIVIIHTHHRATENYPGFNIIYRKVRKK